MAKEFPTELLNKYYARGVELCDAETPMVCYCGCLATGLHTMHCSRFASKARAENVKLKRALWLARSKAAKFWANYWFDVAPSEYIKYDRIGRIEGVEKEFILTKVTKHMTASDWVGLWEKVEQLCLAKAEEYK